MVMSLVQQCSLSGEVACSDGFKATITDGVEEQEGFLANLDPLVVEDGIRSPSLLLMV